MSTATVPPSDTDTDVGQELFDLLTAATAPTVHPGVARYCASQLAFFAANNRNKRPVTMTDALIPVLLANRPEDLKKSEDEWPVLAAKEFAYQVKTYATEHGFNCYPRRAGATVTFRFTKPGDDTETESETETDTDV